MTLGISADGAAAALVHPLHAWTNGSLLTAWKLAAGICAGSSVFLTSASAGPIALCTLQTEPHRDILPALRGLWCAV